MVLCEPEGLNFADMCDITPIMASEASPEEKIAQLRSAFFQSSRLASKGTTQIWESHRDQPEFLLGVSKYVQRTLSELLRQKPIEVVSSAEKPVSVYDEIEFCVFLLGASGNLDILEDLKTNDCVEFANLMSRYRVEIERLVHEKTSMDENISAFIEWFFAISEVANKIAYLNSIKRREKELVSSRLIRIIEKETATLIQSLSSSGRTERIDRLRLILTKLAINYSHLPYLEEPTTEEGVIQILSASEEIRRSIAKGFEMARDIGFWQDDPEKQRIHNSIASLISGANQAFIRLVSVSRLEQFYTKHGDNRSRADAYRIEREKILEELSNAYFQGIALFKQSDFSDRSKMPSSVDGVVDHFIQSGEIDEVSFETIHHFVVFGRLPSARLRKIAEKVISLKSRNVFVEEYVIKILTVILNRFSIGAQGEVKNFFLARKIEEFALSQQVTSEHSSSYADVHYALSNYYCTLHSRLRSGKFTDSETPEGGRKTDKGLQKSYESYFRYLALEDERLVKEFPGNRLLPGKDNSEIRKFAADWMRIQKELFERKRQSRILGKQIEILHNARIHEERGVSIEEIFRQLETTIREHFFGICSVEIKNCSESGMDACSECKVDVYCKKNVAVPSVIRRGHDFLSISLGKWYFVVLQFPKSRTANFQAVFEKHSSILLKALRSVIDLEVLKKAHAESTRGQQQFSQFFHKKVAETILAGNSGQDEGARRMVTVSFSDLVNFTAIAERHPPEKVVQILNSFFRRANHVLNLHFATINKYLGDSVMASWGSTSPQENQTTLACESALKLRKIMNAVNLDVIRILGEIGMPLQVRTGISTGVAVVWSIGDDEFRDFTIIGDSVNLANRLEGACRFYGVNILVDEPTRTRTDENFVFRKIDTVRVKGSNTPRTVYELVGLSGESALPVPFEIIDRYEEGLLTYQDGDWKKAETLFHTNAEEWDIPSMLAEQRLHGRTPPKNWDGVTTLNGK